MRQNSQGNNHLLCYLWMVVSTIIPVLLLVACSKEEIVELEDFNYLKRMLVSFKKGGITIVSCERCDQGVFISLSHGKRFKIDNTVPVITIDIQGYWRHNGKLTDIPLETNADETLFLRTSGGLLGIVEDYENWSFVFENNDRITLGKTVYSIDSNNLVRGINHKGFSCEAPENTLPAFRLSKLEGFKYVETDIRFTSDGIPVLIHDSTIERTSDGNGSVHKMSLEELRKYDFGGWKNTRFSGTTIPSLFEFLSLCHDIELCPYLELKAGTKSQIRSVVSMVEEKEMKERVVYISFSSELLEYVLENDSNATIGLIVSAPLSEGSILAAKRLMRESNHVFIDSSDYSDSAVSLCREANIPLEVWTINSIEAIKNLSPYITGVTSDRFHAGRVVLGY